MNVALLGYGKMGKEIEKILLSRHHQIVAIIDNSEDWNKQKEVLQTADVAIEFTTPDTVVANIRHCFDLNLPVVVGTTGWYKQLEEIKSECTHRNQTLFVASNFSIGVNIFFELNKKLAQMMNKYEMYEVEMTEIHHTQKLDAPSGTAITLAQDIITNLDRKKSWALDSESCQEALKIKALREEDVPGTHIVKYNSDIDFIEIHHEAKSRKGFAVGAVMAAEFIAGKKGIFGMHDLLLV